MVRFSSLNSGFVDFPLSVILVNIYLHYDKYALFVSRNQQIKLINKIGLNLSVDNVIRIDE